MRGLWKRRKQGREPDGSRDPWGGRRWWRWPEDCVPHGLFYGEARKHMFGLEDGTADDDHSSAPGLSHGLSQLSGPTRADDNLATYVVATEPVVAAVSVCEGEKGVVGEEWATAVERHATDDLPIPEHDICWEPPVD
ncbi:WW domain-binding protein 4 [Striga asiatica]|uniref:WW domain-binding protein 4 n=1 Tax=Striga asiatica TaxID=4170 RepID=A0A5A7RKB0_STRAF|nr:WW domain-binding protein 4 [Striga asiatica]